MGKGNLRATFYEGWRAAPRYPRAAGVMGLAGVAAMTGTLGAGWWDGWKGYAGAIVAAVVVAIGLAAITVNKGQKAERPLSGLAGLVVFLGIAFGAAGIAQAIDHGGWGWIGTGFVFFIFLAGTGVWFGKEVMYPGTTKAWLNRRQAQSQANHGTASRADICELASDAKVRRDIGIIRPSMAGLSWWQKRRMDVAEFGILLVKLGTGLAPWHKIYASFEQFTVMFGGPRIGKTQLLAKIASRAPGFLITTSTRSDVAESVHSRRSRPQGWKPTSRSWWARVKAWVLRKSPLESAEGFGREVHVWNPTSDESMPSTVFGSVVAGCRDFTVAERRAAYFIPDTPGDNSEIRRWDSYARPLFALYLHCAALTGRDMQKVSEWNGDLPPENSDRCQARTDLEKALERNPDEEQRRTLKARIAAHYGLPSRTRGSVTFTVTQALQWLASPKGRAMGDAPANDERLFDARRAVQNSETVHVVGADIQPELAALNRWFMSEIEYTIEELAKTMPNQRLDPPAMGCFDEAGLVAKLPLHQWSQHLGGFGFCMVASFQSLSQMEATLGEAAAKTTMGNANNLVVFGGGNSADDLSRITALLGQARYKNQGEDQGAADSHTWKKSFDEAGIRSLRKGEVLVLRQEVPPILGRAPQIWQEKGYERIPVRPALDAAVEELAANEDTIPNAITLPAQKVDEEARS